MASRPQGTGRAGGGSSQRRRGPGTGGLRRDRDHPPRSGWATDERRSDRGARPVGRRCPAAPPQPGGRVLLRDRGGFRIWRGEEILDVGPGGVALLPRDQIHTFRNVGEATGRLLTVIVPAGFERFFEAIADRG